MPEIIIEQSQEVINYINMLKLPISEALSNHMVNTVSGIIATEGNKTVSAIYRKLTCNRDRSSGTRFLGEYKWNNEYVDYKRINHSLETVQRNVDEGSLPLNYKLYLRKQYFGKKAKKYFKNKQELAMQLIDEFVPATEITYLLVDAWYTSGKLMLHALRKGYHTIGRIKSNRVIYQVALKPTSRSSLPLYVRTKPVQLQQVTILITCTGMKVKSMILRMP